MDIETPKPPSTPGTGQTRVRVVVATTVMLSFISFWRAAAIVLNDLGSSAFYVGGIAEKAETLAAVVRDAAGQRDVRGGHPDPHHLR